MGVRFDALVECDGPDCEQACLARVRATVDNSHCGWSGCGCTPGALEVEWREEQQGKWHELWSKDRGWWFLCNTCFRKGVE